MAPNNGRTLVDANLNLVKQQADGDKAYSVPAVEKALDILEYLSDQAVARTRTQIARALGRGPSELFRMLTSLENRGYLYRDPASGGYSLSLRLFELSRTHSPYESILRVARPAMYQLTLEIGESCHLSVLHKKKLLVLAQEESPQPFRYSVEIGALHPLHRMPSGRIILANMSQEDRDEILNHDPDFQTLSSAQRNRFMRRLDLIRRRGYEMTTGEVIVGLINIGVPIGAAKYKTKAILMVSILKRSGQTSPSGILPAVMRCAESIGRSLGLAER
jgi:DNA-binding IclR family transcriptional regulator